MIHYWALWGTRILVRCALPVLAGVVLCLLSWRWNRESAEFLEHIQQVEGRILEFHKLESGWRIDVEHLDVEGVPYRGAYTVSNNDEPTLRAA
ncbi:MAG: hypothetical protein FJ405_20030, partial [Verrucomicrobia bacterium]|nr:hypothetical protein [Verrucomicrobiota bacterium]